MTGTQTPGRASIPGKTLRIDRWWLPQALTAGGLGLFAIYATILSLIHI